MIATASPPPVFRATAQQAVFRVLLDAMARPGTVGDLKSWLSGAPAALGVLTALCDRTVGLADLTSTLTDTEWAFLGAKRSDASAAEFILADGAAPPPRNFAPRLGGLETPEDGATVVLTISALGAEPNAELSGPGVAGSRTIGLGGLHHDWMEQRARWVSDFPLGVDVFVCDARGQVAALPRTTRMEQPA